VHSTRHDPNLAALHAASALPGDVLDVVVLTADAGVLATLREASGPEHALWHAPSADVAVDLLVGGRCGILIADLGALRGDVAALLDRLHTQFPELVLMATGRRDEEGAVASLVANGLIYRFLHKPVSPARAGLFITAATRRYHELRNVEPVGMTTVKTIAAKPHVARIAAGVAVLILAAIAAFAVWRSSDEPVPVAVPHSPVNAPTTAEQIADQLARGQIAYATGRIAEPRGDNALEYYRSVLALQPDHADALAGVARVVAALETRVIETLRARNAQHGAAALAALRRAQPNHPRLDALQAELIAISRTAAASMTQKANVESRSDQRAREESTIPAPAPEQSTDQVPVDEAPAQAADVSASASESTSPSPGAPDLQRVVELRERGALIGPPGANAYDALTAVRDEFPDADEVRAELQRLAFALLEQTRTALAANELDDAAAFLTRTESLVPRMATTRALNEQLASAQQQRDFEANVVQAATLKRVREAAPVYPREAQRKGVEGWVDVEFTIARDGSTRDLVVRDAERGEVFGEAALDSVRRWRFEPVMRNGEAVAQRAVLRVRFVLQ
jgi:TonB family protein